MKGYKVQRRGIDVSEDYFNLVRLSFDDAAAARSANALPWLLSWNPEGHPTGTFFITLEYKGDVVGGAIILADTVWLDGAEHPAFMPIGVNVHPEHRGRGLQLLKALYDLSEKGILLGIPNDQHFGIHRRLGAAISRTRTVRFRPFRAGAVLAKRGSTLAALSPVADVALTAVSGAVNFVAPRLRQGERVEQLDVFGADFDAFWRAARQRHSFLCVRSAARMHWRYREAPFSRYSVDVLRRDGAINGVIVSRVSKRRGRVIGEVSDILCVEADPRDYALLLGGASRRFADAGVDFAECAFIGDNAIDVAARRAGFWFPRRHRQVAAIGFGPRDAESVNRRIDVLHFLRGDHDEDY